MLLAVAVTMAGLDGATARALARDDETPRVRA
jgi:hypothetical protein